MKAGVLVGVATFVLLAACASGGRSACEPVTGDYLEAGRVYSDCEVSRPAELKGWPRFERPQRMGGAQICYVAWYDYVVDTLGQPVASTLKLISTNNNEWAEIVRQDLSEARYEPAMKDGRLVQQLVRFKAQFPRSAQLSPGERPKARDPEGGGCGTSRR